MEWKLCSWEGVVTETKFPHMDGDRVELCSPKGGVQQQIHGTKSGENSAQRLMPTSIFQPEILFCMHATVSRGWVLMLRLWRYNPRVRTSVDCPDNSLKELVKYS